jgi:pyridoxamine 5'-phosphate oxidase
MLATMSSADPADPAVTNPLALFRDWFDDAVRSGVVEPEVMALATATPDGRPSVRYVLYRGLSGDGIRFFTSLESRKGGELEANPRAAVAFFWTAPGRRHQIRLEGRIERLPAAEDDAYYSSRPRGHQLAAWASPQSRAIAHPELLARYGELERAHQGREVPRPAHWGGFRLVPEVVERWIAQNNRLHLRTRYRREGDRWIIEELGP